MLFWVAAAFLTALACLALLLPAVGRDGPRARDAEHDIEVYKDQLAEVERDVARGVVEPADAETARAEIGRRILRLADDGPAQAAHAGFSRGAKAVLSVAVLSVPVLSWGLYGLTGSPGLPAQPLQARLEADPSEGGIGDLVARAEAHLAANPSDARGWDVLAPIYLRTGRYQDAATAYDNAIRLDGASADREAGRAEAIAADAGGLVTAQAQAALERAVALDPMHLRARYLLGLGHAQENADAEAREAWTGLLADLPEDSPWIATVRQALANLADDGADAPPGPTAREMAGAASMDAGDRSRMIEEMVDGLDNRLAENPDDIDGWLRLVRSYAVLGRAGEAVSAYRRAVTAFAGGGEEVARLEELARSLDLSLEPDIEER